MQDLGGEHLSDVTGSTAGGSGPAPTAGYGGGGASAFPAEQSGKVSAVAHTFHLGRSVGFRYRDPAKRLLTPLRHCVSHARPSLPYPVPPDRLQL